MNEIITEKTYPIQNVWLFRQTFQGMSIAFILLFFIFLSNIKGFFSPSGLVFTVAIFLLGIILSSHSIMHVFQRANFSFRLEEQFLALNQGVISKQTRNIPYGHIQAIYLNQGYFDRMFHLASLTFDDTSVEGTSYMDHKGFVGRGKFRREVLGFMGNKIHIPGLKQNDAEALKMILLQKIKENSTK